MVEAHGTGTVLGDPIEAQALISVYGKDREADQPLWLGSVKSNIGHTQAVAGIAGVIKMVMAIRHGVLPATLHAEEPSPHVDWTAGDVRLLTDPVPWPARPDHVRRAAISSFGVSGTNAHLVLVEPPADQPATTGDFKEIPGGVVPWVLSGHTPAALRAQAARLLTVWDNGDLDAVEVGWTLASARGVLDHRAVVRGRDADELRAGLARLTQDDAGTGAGAAGAIGFLFAGQGTWRVGVGRELYAAFPVFADAFDEVCARMDRLRGAGPGLAAVVFAGEGDALAGLTGETEWAQPALFALEVALFRLVSSCGVRPDYVSGHSLGEIVAAHVAGVLSLDDTCVLVEARARLMQALPAGGSMAAVNASRSEVDQWLGAGATGLSVAAVNGTSSVVLSGHREAVDAAVSYWNGQGRRVSRLKVSHAFHSALVEPMLADFAQVVGSVELRSPVIPLVSNLTGRIATAAELRDPGHWMRHVRETVRFSDCVDALCAAGVTRFLELGPDTTLTSITTEHLAEAAGRRDVFAALLRPARSEPDAVVEALAGLFTAGVDVDWSVLFAGTGARRVALPSYAFQRDHYWLNPEAAAVDVTAVGLRGCGHPLLGAVAELADGGVVMTGRVSLDTAPWLADHRVGDTVLVAGTAFVELALRAATHVGQQVVEELVLRSPLVLAEFEPADLQVVVSALGADGRRAVSIHSRSSATEDVAAWECHATGTLGAETGAATTADALSGPWPPAGCEPVDISQVYERWEQAGLSFGQSFRGLRGLWWREGELFAEVAAPDSVLPSSFGIHPALLDAALHPLLYTELHTPGTDYDHQDQTWLPFSWSGVRLYGAGSGDLRARLVPVGLGSTEVTVADLTGRLVLTADALVTRPLRDAGLTEAVASRSPKPLRLNWVPVHVESRVDIPGPQHWTVLRPEATGGPAGEVAVPVLAALREFLGDEGKPESRLAVWTRSAVATGQGEEPDPAQAAVWGLVRSAQTENPGRILLLDSDTTGPDVLPEVVVAAFAQGEDQVALRGGRAFVPRVTRVVAGPEDSDVPVFGGGAVLVTGGTGTLGAVVARHLVAGHGVRDLVLVSRGGRDVVGAADLVEELVEAGARVQVAACDVSDREALSTLLADVERDRPVTGLVHAAGVLADAPVSSLTDDGLRKALAAKADGAWHLHELLGDRVSAFVLFSSVAGVFGGAGQSGYAAANAFLDALAHQRVAQGMAAVSMSWGLWEERSAMTGHLGDRELHRLRQAGMTPLPTAAALRLFDAALTTGEPHLITTSLGTAGLRRLTSGPSDAKPVSTAGTGDTVEAFQDQLRNLDTDQRAQQLTDLVRTHTAAVLGHRDQHSLGSGLGVHGTFRDLGMDSLTGIELRNRLREATGVLLPATAVFDHPTPAELAAHLQSLLFPPHDRSQLAVLHESVDQLEAFLAGQDEGDENRDALLGRLEKLYLRTRRAADAGDREALQERLSSSSDDDMFKFIDETLSVDSR